ncbi:MAG TPA: hypothetical protein VFF66_10090 [Brevundimonas sp.]|nr:hypothetical protein [Brevundimonas sp.]
MDSKPPDRTPAARSSGLVVGGLGGPEEEMLESGQEEVFSRTEVESGRIEHGARAGGRGGDQEGDRKPPSDPEA